MLKMTDQALSKRTIEQLQGEMNILDYFYGKGWLNLSGMVRRRAVNHEMIRRFEKRA